MGIAATRRTRSFAGRTRFAARVLSAVASGLGGRFFEQLRDKQSLAYTVAAFPIERHVSGAFAAYIATSPDREEEARAGLLHEFAKLREAPPTEEESHDHQLQHHRHHRYHRYHRHRSLSGSPV